MREQTAIRGFFVAFLWRFCDAFVARPGRFVYSAAAAAIIRCVRKVVVTVIVALVAICVLVNVSGSSDGVTVCVYADGDATAVFDAAAYAIEPLGNDIAGSEEYIAAACENALRRDGRFADVSVSVDGAVVTVRVDGSQNLAVRSQKGGAVFGFSSLFYGEE